VRAEQLLEDAALLRRYNDWRRGLYPDDEPIEQPHPHAIGQAIDSAIDAMKQMASAQARAEAAEALLLDAYDWLSEGRGCNRKMAERIRTFIECANKEKV
jgi:signal transduction protein with GAF and PtsI domain